MTSLETQPKKRIDSIDVVRGLVMVIMALDHSRDFLSVLDYQPTDLSKASTVLFFTRFITHYCAPTFIFLTGTGAFLFLNNGKTKNQAARFLLSRGIWLIILEMTVFHVGWQMTLNYSFSFLQVIWVIGISMIILSALIYLPARVLAAFGLLLIAGHNLLDKVNPASFGHAGVVIWDFLHVQNVVSIGHFQFFVLYPLIPWVGVMALGYSFGALYKLEAARRKRILLAIGFSAIALFIILRVFINGYGDPFAWANQHVWYRTGLAFINVQKYPPSLDYLLITLGPIMLLLAVLETVQTKVTNVLVVYGRVPLFYYILHLYLLRLFQGIALVICKYTHTPFGFGLPVVYLVWLLTVFILYFPARWYMNYKREHKQWWLGYI
jgi:uncharacterized membrane protein